jgi:hypothetical protein
MPVTGRGDFYRMGCFLFFWAARHQLPQQFYKKTSRRAVGGGAMLRGSPYWLGRSSRRVCRQSRHHSTALPQNHSCSIANVAHIETQVF